MELPAIVRLLVGACWLTGCIVSGTTANAQGVATPSAVQTFYNGILSMDAGVTPARLGELEMDMRGCFFGKENSGMNLPNDFRFFDCDRETASHMLEVLTSNNYVGKLSAYIPAGELEPRISVSSMSRMVGKLPDFLNGSMATGNAYVETIVRKQYSDAHTMRDFVDTVYTHVAYNKIMCIVNGNGTNAVNPSRLRVEAAHAYGEKDYAKAYNLLLRIVSLDRRDGDSYYRLALMTYYGRGCKRSRKLALDYLRMAADNLDWGYRDKIRNVETYWRYPNQ